ncbi:MAG: thymidylate synthase [Bacilli bacterium]|nr:thymidylate synthase [Bacilli bacterium]
MVINGKEFNSLNKEDYKIRDFDKAYCELLKDILKNGELFENRTGIDTLSVEGVNFKLDLGKEFPLLESKKVLLKNALSEMLWIYQAQTNDVSWLRERGNNIWNEWEVDSDGIYRIYESTTENYDKDKEVNVYDLDGNIIIGMKAKSNIEGKNIKAAKFYGKEYAGTIGTAYGYIINKYKRLDYVLNALKNNPHDRRMLISLWQDADLRTAVLPSCVWSSEWKVKNGKLNSYIHQRSADVPLGLPFNISQYAILQSLLAKVSGLEVGNMNYSIMDAHVYVNQVDGIKKQLERYNKMNFYEEMIKNSNQKYILRLYNSKRKYIEFLEKTDNKEELQRAKEDLLLLELMITKKKPKLELADKKDFYEFSNQVNNDKDYLKENVTGNEDIKVLNYSSAPFIKMPVAQ